LGDNRFLREWACFAIVTPFMGDYPGRKQVRNRAKRAAKNDRIIAKKAAAAKK
jgi:hypothetical protein